MEYTKKNVWDEVEDKNSIFEFSKGYLSFLTAVKTEREAVNYLEEEAKKRNYVDLKTIDKLLENQPFYFNHRNKSFFMGTISGLLKEGMHFLGAHIDAPRLDIKSQPLYEEEGVALFKTHYYGGIKKYQWVTMPLSLHGVVYKKDGSKVTVAIGHRNTDPVFTITDLLPHLARTQMQETMAKGIKGEQLNVLVGSMPVEKKAKDKEEKGRIKKLILDYLEKEYGIEEEDFLRSELEIVPAFTPRDVGLDRSMVGAYGQDDRVCSYTLMESLFESKSLKKSVLACFFDKEEIGSSGDTGAKSRVLEYLVTLLIEKIGEKVAPLEVLYNSKALSSDVSACDDPSYPGAFDNYNKATIGNGVVISKYTGSGGKYDANDASAEYVAEIMSILEKHNVIYQFGELGKVDEGGGGTIAQYLSELGMEIIDIGTGLLSMHSPFEIASKGDIYMTYLAQKGFIES